MGMIWQKLIAPEPASAGYSCTITIGSDLELGAYGYSVGLEFGSIDVEPISGAILFVCAWFSDGSYLSVQFDGDLTGLIGSFDVWLGGVNYGGSGEWGFDFGLTFLDKTSGPTATSGTILLEIK